LKQVKLRQILDRIQRTTVRIELFGVTPEFETVYNARLDRLSEAICLEAGIKKDDGDDPMSLPESTTFTTTRVIKAYERLCEWLDSRRIKIPQDAEKKE
jgi:hypothetical protein